MKAVSVAIAGRDWRTAIHKKPAPTARGIPVTHAWRVPSRVRWQPKDNASTVKLEVNIPTDAPIASVSVKPVAGWTARCIHARPYLLLWIRSRGQRAQIAGTAGGSRWRLS
jgi:uncharacterized protein DUF1775